MVKSNITGIWRHVRLTSLVDGVTTGVDVDGSLISAGYPLNGIYLIIQSATPKLSMETTPVPMLVGTPKTKVVRISFASDTLSITGPLLFAEVDAALTPSLVLDKTSGVYGDAANVAAAYLGTMLDPIALDGLTSFASAIGFTLDENGANFNITLEGDPGSLYPDFSDPDDDTIMIPFGYDADEYGLLPGTPTTPIGTALRVGSWYDFYITGTIRAKNNSGFETAQSIDGVVSKMSFNIQISSEKIPILGNDQAPLFAISSIQMTGSMDVIFPLLVDNGVNFPTPFTTMQRLDSVWGTTYSTGDFPNYPDVFTIDTISAVPKYKVNDAPLFSDSLMGVDLSAVDVVFNETSVDIGTGVLKASLSYIVIFTE